MNKPTITLLFILMLLVGGHVGWHVRGIGEETRIDDEAHRRLSNFVIRGVERGLIQIDTTKMWDTAGTHMPPP
ncbi:MAG: hypothetical protein WCO42_00840 [bacterium]